MKEPNPWTSFLFLYFPYLTLSLYFVERWPLRDDPCGPRREKARLIFPTSLSNLHYQLSAFFVYPFQLILIVGLFSVASPTFDCVLS